MFLKLCAAYLVLVLLVAGFESDMLNSLSERSVVRRVAVDVAAMGEGRVVRNVDRAFALRPPEGRRDALADLDGYVVNTDVLLQLSAVHGRDQEIPAVLAAAGRRKQTKAGSQCLFDGSSLLDEGSDSSKHGASIKDEDLHTLAVQDDFVSVLRRLPPITKKLHVKWPNKNVTNSTSDMAQYGLRQMIDLNPDWDYQVWSDGEVDEYLESHLSLLDWTLAKGTGYAEKSDIWRLILLYCEGGYYQDMDRIYNLPMASVLAPETKMLLPVGGADFAQDCMGTAPGNPIFKEAIHLNLARRRAVGNKADPARVLWMGPLTYFNAVTKVMFGVMLERGGGSSLLDRLHGLAEGVSPLIITKRETWCHLIAAEMDDCKWIGRAGLYKEYGIQEWSAAEKARNASLLEQGS